MARVTVEDCIVQVPNRFDLVMLAAQRSRQLTAGAPSIVARDNDRNPVIALREIATGQLDLTKLEDASLTSFRRQLASEAADEVSEFFAEETKALQSYTPELSLTGELDEEEAALDAEFSEIERSMGSTDASE